ncbi:hypothetical protein ACTS9K_16245 [Empedobacter sp. ULE_I145]
MYGYSEMFNKNENGEEAKCLATDCPSPEFFPKNNIYGIHSFWNNTRNIFNYS